jgi:phosphomannomutase
MSGPDFAELQKLQNGSDIRGVAMEGIPGEKVNLTPEVATMLGRALGVWLRKHLAGSGRVAVGTDSRISGEQLKAALIHGLLTVGFDVLDCGLASTPAMFMTTVHPDLHADAGVMLTASHLPFNRNGMKFFTAKGGFDKGNILDLLKIAAELDPHPTALGKGHRDELDFISI